MDHNDPAASEAGPSLSWSYLAIPQDCAKFEQPLVTKANNDQEQGGPIEISTDYESSIAEEGEPYTPGKYESAEQAFLSYSRTNKLEKIQALLDARSRGELYLDLNYRGQQKQNFTWSALHLACYFGHIKVVELILGKKEFRESINMNIQNISGDSPLHKAALTNRASIVQLLLSHGANVFIKNCDGLLAKQLTKDPYILNMLEAAEQADRYKTLQAMFKAVDNGDLETLQEYFQNYDLYLEAQHANEKGAQKNEPDSSQPSKSIQSSSITSEGNLANYPINQLCDERGNTLLHIAAMRGFKATCVYLLERGFDPYRKNNLGQTVMELSSYQLRQLFITVKPSSSHLKRLSTQRVSRFEGPLMKRVRILGWRQTYVVLENGVILLFNNRRDSMNKSRRGYKYLESASCEPSADDIGTFTVCFSDKSKATFLVTADHLNNYTSFKLTGSEVDKLQPVNQIELLRQRWIDSIRDHIRYSTDFIRNGLKLNDSDEDGRFHGNENDLVALNHLLPVDTIKAFVQEARAHYSILERHADSLCNFVKTIITNQPKQQLDSSHDHDQSNSDAQMNQPGASGNRLLGLIRSPRQNRASSGYADDVSINSMQQGPSNYSTRRSNNSMTNEFLQDTWYCILFHLRLLVESTENTKESMGQALALIEHQEQLRQNRMQDQEERCRVLEDSLHALAMDHHELEKSLSMSQIYLSATGRSMSMSTDLNEYYDAFEDFDDEEASRTLTPTSMPTEEDFKRRIREVAFDEEAESESEPKMLSYQQPGSSRMDKTVRNRVLKLATGVDYDEYEDYEDDERSNCSALTADTDDHSIVTISALRADNEISSSKVNTCRTRLPSPMVPRDQVSIWSILKNCIGKELSKITMPVVFNEPLTMLQRACEGIQYSHYLKMADENDNPEERMELICAFIIAGLSANCHRIIKPFNPLLYETYEYIHDLGDGSKVKTIAQQVSHHPPITAVYSESDNFIYTGSVNPKIKFWGRSVEIHPDGECRIILKSRHETYVFKSVACSIHNIIVGKLWFEHHGPLEVRCIETDVSASLTFKQAGWFSNEVHRFEGFISLGKDREKSRYVYGKWSDYVQSVDYSEYENYMQLNNLKNFRIPDSLDDTNHREGDNHNENGSRLPINNNNNGTESGVSQNTLNAAVDQNAVSRGGDKRNQTKVFVSKTAIIPNSKLLWKLDTGYLTDYYNFTLFTMKLNELTPEIKLSIPRTDSRFRLDVRKLEEGDLESAANEKQRLEDKQRLARAKDVRFKEPSPDFLWFDLSQVPYSKEKLWIYRGNYWESKRDDKKFPDLF